MNIDVITNATSIKSIVTQFAPEQIRLLLGEVLEEEPLKVRAVNDEKLIIGADLLLVPQHLTDWREEVVISTDAYNEPDIPVEEATPFEREPEPVRGACKVETHCDNPECSVRSSTEHEECRIIPCAEHHYKTDWMIHRNHLRSGDTIIMTALGGGRHYLILDRIAEEGGADG